MNLRIIIIVTAYFVNVFADQSNWIIHNDINRFDDDDDVDLMSQEFLLPVKTKNTQKPKPVKVNVPPQPHIDQSKKELVQSSTSTDNVKQTQSSMEDDLSSEELIIVKNSRNVPIKSHPVKPSSVSNKDSIPSPTNTIKHPCSDKDVKCHQAKEILIASQQGSQLRDAGRPNLLSKINEQVANTLEELPNNDNIFEEEQHSEESDDDILKSIRDESILRLRRQVSPDDGGSGVGFFEESRNTLEDPEFSIDMAITLEDPVPSGELNEADKAALTRDFETELTQRFSFMPGFKNIVVNDVTLDSENRPKASFSIVLSGQTIGALGDNPEARIENITSTLRQAGDVFQSTDPISGSNTLPMGIEVETFITQLNFLLSDVCRSNQPCEAGYVCVPGETDTGDYTGTCTHACYQSRLNELCQNGASCSLDTNNEPYCQCGTLHTGTFCENNAASTDEATSLSTAEVVGISTGTLLAVAALASCCFFIFFCRKKDDKDMQYSYYGDENDLMEGYLDQASNLGISNMYIDRPRITIQPLDIYNDPHLGTTA